MEEKVTLLSKRKSIQTLLDYCLDQRLTFTVNPKGLSVDDFEISLIINGIKQAIALGMFAKEHKFEVLGQAELPKTKSNSTSVKKTENKENIPVVNESVPNEQQPVTTVLNF